METNKHYIDIVFENSCIEAGLETIQWLKLSNFVTSDQDPETRESSFTKYHLIAQKQIAMDSAVIFVSDEATENVDWQAYIKAIPKGVRLIPIDSGIETVNINDSNVMPPALEEINFIRIDDNLYANILDSLIIDPKFYSMKNHLMVKYNAWMIAGYEGELLTNKKDIKRYKTVFAQNLIDQKDEHLRSQLQGILDYLDASDKYTNQLIRGTVFRWTGRGVLFALAVAIVLLVRWMGVYYKRASYANMVISVDTDSTDPISGTLKMVEAITNPFSTETAKKTAYQKYVALMDKVWEQSPIGQNYKYYINDVAIVSGSQYVWSADSSGKAVLWDTYTGKPESRQRVSQSELLCIAVSRSGNLAALDSEGKLYLGDGKEWIDSGLISSVEPASAKLKITDKTILIYDRNTIEFHGQVDKIQRLAEEDSLNVLDAGIMNDERVLIAASDGGNLVTVTWDGKSAPKYTSIGITVSDRPAIDIRADSLVVCDVTGQVWKLNGDRTQRIPVVLPQVLAVRFVNDSTIVYHERNIGTGLYDIDDFFDYGNVLSDYRAVNEVYASEELLLTRGATNYRVVALDNILKKDQVNAEISYDSKNAEADLSVTRGKGVESLKIEDNGIITVILQLTNGSVMTILDPAMILSNNSGHYADEDIASLPDEYHYYDDEPFISEGRPTVVGIRFVKANTLNKSDYYYILVGCSDGSFHELALDPETGSIRRTCVHTIPSRSAITTIYQTDDGYMLEDVAGRYWKCHSGINTVSRDGIFESVKAKLRSGVSIQMKDLISPDAWDKLELQLYPGSDGKEWE